VRINDIFPHIFNSTGYYTTIRIRNFFIKLKSTQVISTAIPGFWKITPRRAAHKITSLPTSSTLSPPFIYIKFICIAFVRSRTRALFSLQNWNRAFPVISTGIRFSTSRSNHPRVSCAESTFRSLLPLPFYDIAFRSNVSVNVSNVDATFYFVRFRRPILFVYEFCVYNRKALNVVRFKTRLKTIFAYRSRESFFVGISRNIIVTFHFVSDYSTKLFAYRYNYFSYSHYKYRYPRTKNYALL